MCVRVCVKLWADCTSSSVWFGWVRALGFSTVTPSWPLNPHHGICDLLSGIAWTVFSRMIDYTHLEHNEFHTKHSMATLLYRLENTGVSVQKLVYHQYFCFSLFLLDWPASLLKNNANNYICIHYAWNAHASHYARCSVWLQMKTDWLLIDASPQKDITSKKVIGAILVVYPLHWSTKVSKNVC